MLFWCLYCCCSYCCYSSLFWSEGAQCHNIYVLKNPKMYEFVYRETTSCHENVPVLLRGTFYTYSVSANKNKTFVIKWRHEKSWIYLFFENLVRLITLLFSASTIIASWTDCWKYFVLFLPLKGSQEFAFRRVQHCQFIWFFWSEIFNRSIENLLYNLWYNLW